jgi:hypothetical protein
MPLLEDAKDLRDLSLWESLILRQFNARLKPYIGRLDMNVHPILFARVEVEPVGPLRERPLDSSVRIVGFSAADLRQVEIQSRFNNP